MFDTELLIDIGNKAMLARDYKAAEILYKTVLEKQEKVAGEYHSSTISAFYYWTKSLDKLGSSDASFFYDFVLQQYLEDCETKECCSFSIRQLYLDLAIDEIQSKNENLSKMYIEKALQTEITNTLPNWKVLCKFAKRCCGKLKFHDAIDYYTKALEIVPEELSRNILIKLAETFLYHANKRSIRYRPGCAPYSRIKLTHDEKYDVFKIREKGLYYAKAAATFILNYTTLDEQNKYKKQINMDIEDLLKYRCLLEDGWYDLCSEEYDSEFIRKNAAILENFDSIIETDLDDLMKMDDTIEIITQFSDAVSSQEDQIHIEMIKKYYIIKYKLRKLKNIAYRTDNDCLIKTFENYIAKYYSKPMYNNKIGQSFLDFTDAYDIAIKAFMNLDTSESLATFSYNWFYERFEQYKQKLHLNIEEKLEEIKHIDPNVNDNVIENIYWKIHIRNFSLCDKLYQKIKIQTEKYEQYYLKDI